MAIDRPVFCATRSLGVTGLVRAGLIEPGESPRPDAPEVLAMRWVHRNRSIDPGRIAMRSATGGGHGRGRSAGSWPCLFLGQPTISTWLSPRRPTTRSRALNTQEMIRILDSIARDRNIRSEERRV